MYILCIYVHHERIKFHGCVSQQTLNDCQVSIPCSRAFIFWSAARYTTNSRQSLNYPLPWVMLARGTRSVEWGLIWRCLGTWRRMLKQRCDTGPARSCQVLKGKQKKPDRRRWSPELRLQPHIDGRRRWRWHLVRVQVWRAASVGGQHVVCASLTSARRRFIKKRRKYTNFRVLRRQDRHSWLCIPDEGANISIFSFF